MRSCRLKIFKDPREKGVSKRGWKHWNKKFSNTRRWQNTR
jgi:hypothetical protein